jgi:uncharacterized membrane protein
MLFVQATFLAALAAVAIPVIVHLMFRSQARKVNLGTLRFLRQVLERNAQRQRIMRWLLLALRMGAVAVLALLFARPYFLQAGPGGDQKLLLVLIDQSATMDLKGDHGRLIEQAIAEARELVGRQGPRTRIEVAFFDHAVRPLAGDDGSRGGVAERREAALQLLANLPTPVVSYRATNYGAALNWARDISIRAGQGTQELHLYTDLQQSGLDWTEVEPLPEHVVVHLHDLGRAVVNNVAVTEARPIRAVLRPQETATIQATLFNGGAFPIEELSVQVRLESEKGKLTQREKVKLEPSSTAVVKFELPALDAGFWQGVVSIDADDDLAFDNARQVAVFVAAPYRVLLADGEPRNSPLQSETYFLSRALRLADTDERYADSPFESTTVPLTVDDGLPALDRYDVVILANVSQVTPADALKLVDFVKRGNGLIVFGGEQVTAAGYEALAQAGLVPGQIVGPQLATDLPFRIESWDEKQSLLEPFNDPQHGDLRRLAFFGYTKLAVPKEVSADTHVLARFRGGDPALVEQRLGDGMVWWFASSCDRAWSEWPSSRLYVPLVHQLVGQPLGLNDGGPVRAVLLDATGNLPAATVPSVAAQPRYWKVINSSPRESEVDRCDPAEFADRFQVTLTAEGETVTTVAKSRSVDLRSDEQWHWAAFLLGGLLLLESFVGNRTVS